MLGGGRYPFGCQSVGDLRRPEALHTEIEYLSYHLRCFLIDDPFCFVFRVLQITVWWSRRQWNAGFALAAEYCPNLL